MRRRPLDRRGHRRLLHRRRRYPPLRTDLARGRHRGSRRRHFDPPRFGLRRCRILVLHRLKVWIRFRLQYSAKKRRLGCVILS